MGIFDEIIGICNICQAEFRIQTKLDNRSLREIHINDDFNFQDGRLLLKEPCPNDHKIVITIRDKKILCYDTNSLNWDFKELIFGRYEVNSNAEEEEVINDEM